MSEEKLTQDIVEGMVTKMARELPYEKQKIFFLLLAERTFRCYKKTFRGQKMGLCGTFESNHRGLLGLYDKWHRI